MTGATRFPGQVIRYAYHWKREHDQGREEASKDRPCAIILVVQSQEGDHIVTVAPVTHSPPLPGTEAITIPPKVKQRLGLDDDRSWIVISELNRFTWPGPDLRTVPGREHEGVVYGHLPPDFFRHVRDKVYQYFAIQGEVVVTRTDRA